MKTQSERSAEETTSGEADEEPRVSLTRARTSPRAPLWSRDVVPDAGDLSELPEIEVSVVPSQRKAARNAHVRAWDRHAEVIALVALFSLFVFVGTICHFLAFRAAAAGRDWFPPLSLFLLGVIFQVHAFLFFAQIAQRSARNSGRGIDS